MDFGLALTEPAEIAEKAPSFGQVGQPRFIDLSGVRSLHAGTVGWVCGHHRHYRNSEDPYSFSGVDVLIADFYRDVEMIRRGEL